MCDSSRSAHVKPLRRRLVCNMSDALLQKKNGSTPAETEKTAELARSSRVEAYLSFFTEDKESLPLLVSC